MMVLMKYRILFFSALVASHAWAGPKAAERLNDAAAVFEQVMEIKERAIPQGLLDKSHCVIVVPGVLRAAFGFGGKYGRGYMACRKAGGLGWSAPAGVRIEGGSFGLQIGGSQTDVIMLVMNENGAEKLLKSKVTLGADAAAAAGPVGRSASAETDALMRAEILTWSRSRGLFAGISLQGATLRQDSRANEEVYGKVVSNAEIVHGKVTAPSSAARLLGLLNKYSSRKAG
jgi:lipid-binding SYLF domain-containing protein